MASRRKKVLIVDDNQDAADSLAMLVKLKGHEAFVAYDAETGLEVAHKSTPDVILHDINLPHMSGYEAVHRLRRDKKLESTTFVALTAFATTDDRKRALSEGFDLHMSKPVEFNELYRILDNVRV